MIPISLSITGFGPYLESQTIDFTSYAADRPAYILS